MHIGVSPSLPSHGAFSASPNHNCDKIWTDFSHWLLSEFVCPKSTTRREIFLSVVQSFVFRPSISKSRWHQPEQKEEKKCLYMDDSRSWFDIKWARSLFNYLISRIMTEGGQSATHLNGIFRLRVIYHRKNKNERVLAIRRQQTGEKCLWPTEPSLNRNTYTVANSLITKFWLGL